MQIGALIRSELEKQLHTYALKTRVALLSQRPAWGLVETAIDGLKYNVPPDAEDWRHACFSYVDPRMRQFHDALRKLDADVAALDATRTRLDDAFRKMKTLSDEFQAYRRALRERSESKSGVVLPDAQRLDLFHRLVESSLVRPRSVEDETEMFLNLILVPEFRILALGHEMHQMQTKLKEQHAELMSKTHTATLEDDEQLLALLVETTAGRVSVLETELQSWHASDQDLELAIAKDRLMSLLHAITMHQPDDSQLLSDFLEQSIDNVLETWQKHTGTSAEDDVDTLLDESQVVVAHLHRQCRADRQEIALAHRRDEETAHRHLQQHALSLQASIAATRRVAMRILGRLVTTDGSASDQDVDDACRRFAGLRAYLESHNIVSKGMLPLDTLTFAKPTTSLPSVEDARRLLLTRRVARTLTRRV